jgi:hypothetical protein
MTQRLALTQPPPLPPRFELATAAVACTSWSSPPLPDDFSPRYSVEESSAAERMDAVQQEMDDYLNPRPSLLEVMNPSSASSPEALKPRRHLASGSDFMIIIDWKINAK